MSSESCCGPSAGCHRCTPKPKQVVVTVKPTVKPEPRTLQEIVADINVYVREQRRCFEQYRAAMDCAQEWLGKANVAKTRERELWDEFNAYIEPRGEF